MSTHETLANSPVVILAGGLGTRLRSIVSDRPKALAPIGEQPFLEIQIGLLRDQGRGGSCSASAIAPSRSRTCWETGGD